VISFKHILTAAVGVLIITVSVRAQDDSHMSMHMMPQTADNRQLVDLPPAMRQHMLSNMRAHLVALGEIVAALSSGDSAKAAEIAETRLGLDSPDAAACNPNHGADAPAMAAMMAEHMPEEMRNLGFAMHAAASTFAREAAKAQQSNDVKPALAALSQVTQSCAACHSAYRLQ
jgi:cytochrome c556